MQVHVGPSMEKLELSSDLKFLSKIQIEWFKVLQIGIENIYNLALVSSSNSLRILHDQDLIRSDFVELNQELGDEFLNETNWMRTISEEKKKKWNRTRILFVLWEFLFDGVEEVQGRISQGKPSFDL
nr:uncharacterized protein LOC127296063 isoform X2 [Lolium perenne]XP_051182056.1 uncharacterized protein LOC127296065 [Lolium perenne]